MRKMVLAFLFIASSVSAASVMRTYRLVWDTGKIASFGTGFVFNLMDNDPTHVSSLQGDSAKQPRDNIFGPVLDVEAGIAGYEYSAGFKLGKIQQQSKSTYLVMIFAGKSNHWMDLKTNINHDHWVFGVRLNRRLVEWAVKYHTDLKNDKIVSVQFGTGG